MKKFKFLLMGGIALAMSCVSLNAQVGINTETPSNKGLHILQLDTVGAEKHGHAFRLEDGNQAQGYLLTTDANGNGTWMKPDASWFYMPSLLLPVVEADVALVTGASYAANTFTINLFQNLQSQFTTTASVVRSAAAPDLNVQTAGNKYYYYVTYYDADVFQNVTIDANGLLTYKVNATAPITQKTFMNIILKEKK